MGLSPGRERRATSLRYRELAWRSRAEAAAHRGGVPKAPGRRVAIARGWARREQATQKPKPTPNGRVLEPRRFRGRCAIAAGCVGVVAAGRVWGVVPGRRVSGAAVMNRSASRWVVAVEFLSCLCEIRGILLLTRSCRRCHIVGVQIAGPTVIRGWRRQLMPCPGSCSSREVSVMT